MSNLFNSVKVSELPRVLERAANSAFHCNFLFIKMRLPILPLMFGKSFGSDSVSS